MGMESNVTVIVQQTYEKLLKKLRNAEKGLKKLTQETVFNKNTYGNVKKTKTSQKKCKQKQRRIFTTCQKELLTFVDMS